MPPHTSIVNVNVFIFLPKGNYGILNFMEMPKEDTVVQEEAARTGHGCIDFGPLS